VLFVLICLEELVGVASGLAFGGVGGGWGCYVVRGVWGWGDGGVMYVVR